MWRFFHQLGSPKHFYRIAGAWIPWLAVICAGFMLVGFYEDRFPPDQDELSTYIPSFIATRARRGCRVSSGPAPASSRSA